MDNDTIDHNFSANGDILSITPINKPAAER